MLFYNLERMYKIRGIERPYAFFKSKGFSDSYASKLNQGMVTGMKLSTLEKLCEIFNCSPHDLLEWKPIKGSMISKSHPLRELERPNKSPDIYAILKTLPMEKMDEIAEFIMKDSKKEDQ